MASDSPCDSPCDSVPSAPEVPKDQHTSVFTPVPSTNYKHLPTTHDADNSATGSSETNCSACANVVEEPKMSEVPLYEKYRHLCSPLSKYLEDQPDDYFAPYMLPEKFFRRFWVMDIVKRHMKNSCCFTKR